MKNGRKSLAALAALSLACVLSCTKTVAGGNEGVRPDARTDIAPDPMVITPNDTMRSQIRVGPVKVQPLGEVISVAARVEVDGTRITRVGSPVMGRVTSLLVQEGQQVELGQTLALVSSTLLSEGQLTLVKVLSKSQVAQRAVERARILLKSEVIGAVEMQRREAELAEAEAEREAARDQLLLLGMPPEAVEELERTRKINSIARIVASMRGTVLSRRVTLGQVVQPADAAFEIADLSSLWLSADVPVPDAGGVYIGETCQATIAALGGSRISGKLSFVSAMVNDETRTVRVHMPLENTRGWYKPAMLAELRLNGRAELRPCVPSTAVVREGDAEHLFVAGPADGFTLRAVQLGDEYGSCRALTSGLDPKEKIVLDGAFHLNNERRRRALRGSGGE